MFIKFGESFRDMRATYFPTRQFFLYVNDEMKFLHLETGRQLKIAISLVAILILTALLSYDVYFGFTAKKADPAETLIVVAEYDRAILDTEAQYETTQAHFVKRQAAFDKVSARLQEKQDVLDLLEELGYLDNVALNLVKPSTKKAF